MPITISREPDQLTASKNDTWVTVNTPDTNVNFQMKVFAQPENILIATLGTPADATGNGYFNLKRILQSMGVAPDILNYQLPVFNQLVASQSLNNIKYYSLTFHTLDRSTGAVVSTYEYNNGSQVLLAGKNFLLGNTNLQNIIGTGAQKRKFLTWQPLEKTTRKDAQEYLYYYHNETLGLPVSISLKVIIRLSDKTTIEKILLPFTVSVQQLVIFPVGLTQLNLYSYVTGGQQITSYSVCLVKTATPATAITETRIYNIDNRCFPQGREFIFLNSLGGMDGIYAPNTEETGMELITETAERFLPPDYDTQAGQYQPYYKIYFATRKSTTDLLTTDQRNYLQEFFSSPRVWEIRAGKFVPVILTDSNYTLQKNRAALQNIQFSYRYAFDQVGFNTF